MKGFVTFDATKGTYDANDLAYSNNPTIKVRLYDDRFVDVPEELKGNKKALEHFLQGNNASIYSKDFGVNPDLYSFLNRDLAALQDTYGVIDDADWFTNAQYSNTKRTYDSDDYVPDIIMTPYGEYDKGKRAVDKLADKFRNIFLDSHDFSPLMGPRLDYHESPFIFDPTDPRTPAALKQIAEGKKWYEVDRIPHRLYSWKFNNKPNSFWSKIMKPIEHPAYNMNHPAWLETQSKMPSFAEDPEGFMNYTPDRGRRLPDVSEYIGRPDLAAKLVDGVVYTRDPIGTKEYKVNKDGEWENVNKNDIIETQSDNPNYKYITFDEDLGRYVPVKEVDISKGFNRIPGQGKIWLKGRSEDEPEFNEDITAAIFRDKDALKDFFKSHGIKGSGMVTRYADPQTGMSVVNKDGKFKPYDYAAGLLRRRRRDSGEFMDKNDVFNALRGPEADDILSGFMEHSGFDFVKDPAIKALLQNADSIDDVRNMLKYEDPKEEPKVVDEGEEDFIRDADNNIILSNVVDETTKAPPTTMEHTNELANAANNERKAAIKEGLKKFLNFVTHHKWRRVPGEIAIPAHKERIKDENGNEIFKYITKSVDDGKGNMVPKRFKRYKTIDVPETRLPDHVVLDLDDQQIRSRDINDPFSQAKRQVSEQAKALRAFKKALASAMEFNKQEEEYRQNEANPSAEVIANNSSIMDKLLDELGVENFNRATGEIKYTPQMALQELIDNLEAEESAPDIGAGRHSKDNALINRISKKDKYKQYIDLLNQADASKAGIDAINTAIESGDIDDPEIFNKLRENYVKQYKLMQDMYKTGLGQFMDKSNFKNFRKMMGRNKEGQLVEKSRSKLNNDRRQAIKSMFKEKDPKRAKKISEWFKDAYDPREGEQKLLRNRENMYLFLNLFPTEFWEAQLMQGKKTEDILKGLFKLYRNINIKNPGLIKKLRKDAIAQAEERQAQMQRSATQRNIAGTLAGLNMHNN